MRGRGEGATPSQSGLRRTNCYSGLSVAGALGRQSAQQCFVPRSRHAPDAESINSATLVVFPLFVCLFVSLMFVADVVLYRAAAGDQLDHASPHSPAPSLCAPLPAVFTQLKSKLTKSLCQRKLVSVWRCVFDCAVATLSLALAYLKTTVAMYRYILHNSGSVT